MTDSSLLNLSYHSAGKFATGPPSRAINMRTRITQPSGAATPRNSDAHKCIAVPKAFCVLRSTLGPGMFVNVQYVSRVVIAPHLKRPCFGVCALVRDFSPKAECVLDLARESKRGPFVREVEKRLGDKIYGSSFARFFSSAGVEGSQGTGKCMCIKAWRNQWLQMRHWQIAHPFYKMGLHTNAAKDGVINYAGLQGEHIPDE